MKKIVLLIVALVSINSFAQTEKGKILIGAHSNLGASFINHSFKNDNEASQKIASTKAFIFSPNAGFFIANNLVLGLDLTLSYSSVKNEFAGGDSSHNGIYVGPFVKYYLLEGKFRPFTMAKYIFGRIKNTSLDHFGHNSSYKSSSNSLTIGAGAAYFVNNYISLEFSLDYARNISKAIENNPTNHRSITSGLSSSIGFAIFL